MDKEPVHYVWAEYTLDLRPSELAALLNNPRVKTAEAKAHCKIHVTKRVLNKRSGNAGWSRHAIVRITGPDDQSVGQCNRLLEQAIPIYKWRKEYSRRAPLTFYSRNIEEESDLRSRLSDIVSAKKKLYADTHKTLDDDRYGFTTAAEFRSFSAQSRPESTTESPDVFSTNEMTQPPSPSPKHPNEHRKSSQPAVDNHPNAPPLRMISSRLSFDLSASGVGGKEAHTMDQSVRQTSVSSLKDGVDDPQYRVESSYSMQMRSSHVDNGPESEPRAAMALRSSGGLGADRNVAVSESYQESIPRSSSRGLFPRADAQPSSTHVSTDKVFESSPSGTSKAALDRENRASARNSYGRRKTSDNLSLVSQSRSISSSKIKETQIDQGRCTHEQCVCTHDATKPTDQVELQHTSYTRSDFNVTSTVSGQMLGEAVSDAGYQVVIRVCDCPQCDSISDNRSEPALVYVGITHQLSLQIEDGRDRDLPRPASQPVEFTDQSFFTQADFNVTSKESGQLASEIVSGTGYQFSVSGIKKRSSSKNRTESAVSHELTMNFGISHQASDQVDLGNVEDGLAVKAALTSQVPLDSVHPPRSDSPTTPYTTAHSQTRSVGSIVIQCEVQTELDPVGHTEGLIVPEPSTPTVRDVDDVPLPKVDSSFSVEVFTTIEIFIPTERLSSTGGLSIVPTMAVKPSKALCTEEVNFDTTTEHAENIPDTVDVSVSIGVILPKPDTVTIEPLDNQELAASDQGPSPTTVLELNPKPVGFDSTIAKLSNESRDDIDGGLSRPQPSTHVPSAMTPVTSTTKRTTSHSPDLLQIITPSPKPSDPGSIVSYQHSEHQVKDGTAILESHTSLQFSGGSKELSEANSLHDQAQPPSKEEDGEDVRQTVNYALTLPTISKAPSAPAMTPAQCHLEGERKSTRPNSPLSIGTSISTNIEFHIHHGTGRIDLSLELTDSPVGCGHSDMSASAGPGCSTSTDWNIKLELNGTFGPVGCISPSSHSSDSSTHSPSMAIH